MDQVSQKDRKKPAGLWIARLGFGLTILALLSMTAIVLMPHAVGEEQLEYVMQSFLFCIKVLLLTGVVAVVHLIISLFIKSKHGVKLAAATLFLVLAGLSVPLSHFVERKASLPLHDITTDTDNPPVFVSVLPLRANAFNAAEYGGADVAALQKKAYPEIMPLFVGQAPREVITASETVARQLGWSIVAVVPEEGRLEATDTTRWIGFKDDVVIRVTAEGEGSRVDVRSVSRQGNNDMGANARRVKSFLSTLSAKLK